MNIDPVTQMYERAPLMRFSPYTHIQVRTALDLGQELRELLDKSMVGTTIDGAGFTRAYSLFWLWVLATYEITRTMCQRKECFSEAFAGRICEYKGRVSILRMPFAKLELQRKAGPITGEASVSIIDAGTKDIGFVVEGERIHAREMMGMFDALMASVTSADVRMSIYGQDYYPKGT